ncbi:NAD-P-binding protein [Mycena sp. CBHHK59/15]|nr:NAD-P-binding protein [Mycena sp. CBHHK59/15]
MSRGVVLVTGITGYIGTYTALAFLEGGYTVKGTARTASKAEDWIARFPTHKTNYQYAVVPVLGAPGAFDEVVKGCDIIAHVASPVQSIPNQDNEADVLIPAVKGTLDLLRATKNEPRIRRVIFTSTLGAAMEPTQFEAGSTLTEKDWNPATYEEAKASADPRFVYRASKALAERAFWDYIKDEKPAWAGATILPAGVFDPPIQPLTSLAALNRSVAFIWNVANGKFKAGAPAYNPSVYVSAGDVALAHVRAAERDEAKNQRYLLIGGDYPPDVVVEMIQRNFPELKDKLPPTNLSKHIPFKFDASKTEKELGITSTPLEKTVVETIASVLALDKQFSA